MSSPWKIARAACLCALITSLAASDVYDEAPPADLGLFYQEHNYIEPVEIPSLDPRDEAVMRFLLFFKMLSTIKNQGGSPNLLAGPKWLSPDMKLAAPETFDLPLMKGSILKRGSETDVSASKAREVPMKSIPKWNKKVGSHVICYFKLCSFRTPNK